MCLLILTLAMSPGSTFLCSSYTLRHASSFAHRDVRQEATEVCFFKASSPLISRSVTDGEHMLVSFLPLMHSAQSRDAFSVVPGGFTHLKELLREGLHGGAPPLALQQAGRLLHGGLHIGLRQAIQQALHALGQPLGRSCSRRALSSRQKARSQREGDKQRVVQLPLAYVWAKAS